MGNFVGGPHDATKAPPLEKSSAGPNYWEHASTIDGKPVVCLYELDAGGNYFFVGVKA